MKRKSYIVVLLSSLLLFWKSLSDKAFYFVSDENDISLTEAATMTIRAPIQPCSDSGSLSMNTEVRTETTGSRYPSTATV